MSQSVDIMSEIIKGQEDTLTSQAVSIRQLRDIVLARNNEVSDLRHRMAAIQDAIDRKDYKLARRLSDHTTIRTTYERLHEESDETDSY